MKKRAAFITIGQSPRPDILDEMRPLWGDRLDIDEYGALDGLSTAEIKDLAPARDAARLVSRSRDGMEVVLRAEVVHERVSAIVHRLDSKDYDYVTLLCTGRFDDLDSGHILLKAQPLVDHGVAAIETATHKLGVLVPAAEQQADFDGQVTSYASPYQGDRFEKAASELEAAEVIVLHCMGYDFAHKKRIAALTGKPVLLAREIVASAVSWLTT